MLVFPEGSENIQEVSGTLLKIKNTGREQVVLFPSMVLACIFQKRKSIKFLFFPHSLLSLLSSLFMEMIGGRVED